MEIINRNKFDKFKHLYYKHSSKVVLSWGLDNNKKDFPAKIVNWYHEYSKVSLDRFLNYISNCVKDTNIVFYTPTRESIFVKITNLNFKREDRLHCYGNDLLDCEYDEFFVVINGINLISGFNISVTISSEDILNGLFKYKVLNDEDLVAIKNYSDAEANMEKFSKLYNEINYISELI